MGNRSKESTGEKFAERARLVAPVAAVYDRGRLSESAPACQFKDSGYKNGVHFAIPTKGSSTSLSGVGHGLDGTSNRRIRGGSWNNNADNATVANRDNNNNPDNRNNNIGFRLARSSGRHP
ncbi:hypothetical protein EBU02_14740 [bacterium]|nr:hypothetical protein [bacterium]